MATTVGDAPETMREEQAFPAAPEHEIRPSLRPPINVRYEDNRIPFGPRLRWGGLAAGVVAALALILLLTAFGIAVGLSTVDTSLLSTRDSGQNLATAAGLWTGLTVLLAYFIAGMVSTKVTDRADGGAILHGTLAWMLLSLTLSWLITSGIALSLGGLPGGMHFSPTRGLLSEDPTALTEAGLARRLGLTDPAQLLAPASDERLVNALVTTTNMTREEAQSTLDDLRARVTAVQSDPQAVQAEMSAFLSQIATRIQQQESPDAVVTQQQIERGSWMTFATMLLTLVVTMIGARVGLPRDYRWNRAAVQH